MNPWLSSERVCWQVGVSVCGFSSAHHQPQLEKFSGGCRAGLNWGCVWGGRRLSAAKQKEHISPAPPDLSAVEYAASVNCNYSEISFWHLFSFFSSALGWLPGCIWICNWLSVCAPCFVCGTLWSTCVYVREGERGRAGTRGRFCQEEFAHMTRDLFPPNWLSMPLLPLPSSPTSAFPPAVILVFRFWQKLLIWCPELSFCGHKGAFFSALFRGWYRKLCLSLSDEQIKRFDNDFDALGKGIY